MGGCTGVVIKRIPTLVPSALEWKNDDDGWNGDG